MKFQTVIDATGGGGASDASKAARRTRSARQEAIEAQIRLNAAADEKRLQELSRELAK